MPKHKKLRGVDVAICPHCGHQHDDLPHGVDDEYGYSYDTDGTINCWKCGQPFEFEIVTQQVFYSWKGS